MHAEWDAQVDKHEIQTLRRQGAQLSERPVSTDEEKLRKLEGYTTTKSVEVGAFSTGVCSKRSHEFGEPIRMPHETFLAY